MKKILLRMESFLAMPAFIVSWMICAIALGVRSGYLLAKLDGAAKSALLDKILPAKQPPQTKSDK